MNIFKIATLKSIPSYVSTCSDTRDHKVVKTARFERIAQELKDMGIPLVSRDNLKDILYDEVAKIRTNIFNHLKITFKKKFRKFLKLKGYSVGQKKLIINGSLTKKLLKKIRLFHAIVLKLTQCMDFGLKALLTACNLRRRKTDTSG